MSGAVVREAVLLVGGLGTRLRPLTYKVPKALMPVANIPLIGYEIIPLVRAGVERIIFAVSHHAQALKESLGDGSSWGAEFVYVEEKDRLDTAGAIGNVREHISGHFFACNGDIIYDIDPAALAADHLDNGAMVTFCLRRVDDISHFGLIQWDDSGRVTAFREKVAIDETGRNTVNSGYYVMSPEVFDHIPAGAVYSCETQLFPELLAAGAPLYAHLPSREGFWADVGRVETYLQANGAILEGTLDWHGPKVCGEVAPGAMVADSVHVDEEVIISAGARVGPRVSLGRGTVVEAGAELVDCIVWPHSRIGAGARLHGCIVAGQRVPAGQELQSEVIVE